MGNDKVFFFTHKDSHLYTTSCSPNRHALISKMQTYTRAGGTEESLPTVTAVFGGSNWCDLELQR